MFYDYAPDNECVCIRALIDHKKQREEWETVSILSDYLMIQGFAFSENSY